MSWTDIKSIKQIQKLKNLYNIKTFVETGTFRGINAEVHAHDFNNVITCEINQEYYYEAKKRLDKYENVFIFMGDSFNFLENIKNSMKKDENVFIYLDAHFYGPNALPDDLWVVLKELKALQGSKYFNNFIIAIHDFDNAELGHLNYDGQTLNFDLLKESLYKINPNFNYYTNTIYNCEIVTADLIKENYPYIEIDNNIMDSLDFIWSSPIKSYRGILYCTPTKLDLDNFNLRQL